VAAERGWQREFDDPVPGMKTQGRRKLHHETAEG